MNPHPLFCPNPECSSRGLQHQGNIVVHDSLRDRWRCRTCKKTFSARQGTPFHGLKTDPKIVMLILTLLMNGCPPQAIVRAYGYDERTVASWQHKAGQHTEAVHAALVTSVPMDLRHVQADEIRVKMQKRLVLWLAMAICVPTRLWLGGVVSQHRDKPFLRALACLVAACAQTSPLLVVTDGWRGYAEAWHKAFRTPQPTGKRGRPPLVAWKQVAMAQTVKAYDRGRCIGVGVCRLFGDTSQIARLLPAQQVLNTAYIERLNATFRQRLSALTRKGRALLRKPETLTANMYLLGCFYNWCTPHQSLSKDAPCTPAMAAGLTNHVWSVGELLCYRVPPPPFVPPKKRGRKSKQEQQLFTT